MLRTPGPQPSSPVPISMTLSRRSALARVPVVLVLSLLSLEIALQLYFRLTTGHWLVRQSAYRIEHIVAQRDERIYSYKPNFRDPDGRLTIDEHGFRISRSVPPAPPGATVIAALGDSVPFGYALRDEETYPFQLQQRLRERGSSLPVVNAGVESYNLQQSIAHFRRDVRRHYRPRIITVHTANDAGLLLHYRGSWTPDRTWDPTANGFLHSLVTRSGTMAMIGPRLLELTSGTVETQTARMLEHERRLLDALTDECAAAGIAVILLPVNPFYYQTTNTERNASLSRWPAWSREHAGAETVFDAFNRVMAEVAEAKGPASGVYFFDVRAYLDGEDREPLYIDFIHHSAEGNRRVAHGLAELMAAQGLL